MNDHKYIGMDVHLATVSAAVLDGAGRLIMEATLATQATALLGFLRGLKGSLHVTFEEGTSAEWLYDLLRPHVAEVMVCDSRQNPKRRKENKNDRGDARKLAEGLRMGHLKPVYHGPNSLRHLGELTRSYLTLVKDTTRVMNRLKALYRGRGIACPGTRVYSERGRTSWLEQLPQPGVRERAQMLYQELDLLLPLRRQARAALLQESRRHAAQKWLRSIPSLGPVRSAMLMALIQTPYRFRTKRQLWTYAGLAVVTSSSADYRVVRGELARSRKPVLVLGLNLNHHHDLKALFKDAAASVVAHPGPLRDFYATRVAQGMKPELARLTLARKIACLVWTLWKKGERFNAQYLKAQAA